MKSVVIKQYKHHEATLWPLIGPHVTDREVQRALGGPIFSGPETTWFVATDHGKTVGFASLRDAKGAYWLDCAYVLPESRGDEMHALLADARDKHIAKLTPKTVKVCCRIARWKHYEDRGFHQDSVRGDWIYGSKLSKSEAK